MDLYTKSYAIGYFYGRVYPSYLADGITMPPQDHYIRDHVSFKDGFEAGQRDFQDVDLPMEAISQEQVDPL